METDTGFDAAAWQQLADLGLLGLAIPEEHGGAGYGLLDVGVVLEEAGRYLLCAPYFSSVVLATTVLLEAGDERASATYLPRMADGSLTGAFALTEDPVRWDAEGVATRAVRNGDGWRLDGTKTFVIDGHTAGVLLVVARTDAGISLFAVDADASGMERTRLETLDPTRRLATVVLSSTPATLVGTDGAGWAVVAKVLDVAAVGLAAEQVGGAARALEMAVDYAKVREQFGRPIGSFQAIKHTCADMLLEVESARSAAYYALWAAATDSEELPVVASIAAAYCGDAFYHCAAKNIQVHGGIGFTWEHPAHLYLKRAKADQLMFGDTAWHLDQLADRVGI
jgi:alkylation response protein AidB-like acyl-CoA dehydrogenase